MATAVLRQADPGHLDNRLKETYRNRTLLDMATFFANLDDAVQRKGSEWADFFIDRYLDQTDRVEEILALLEIWLKETMTIEAFDFVAAVLRHVGGRSNPKLLQTDGIEPIDEIEEIRRDSFFAVAQHSLT